MIGSDLTPQLGPEAHYQIDSADRGSRFPQSGDRGNQLCPMALVQDIKFQVGVRCRSESEYPCLRNVHER